ncbi:17577_t:CDS:1, partial [Cetraspora pellucida]
IEYANGYYITELKFHENWLEFIAETVLDSKQCWPITLNDQYDLYDLYDYL